MIAEKILDDNRVAGKGSWLTVEGINRAMQSYADFYYWLADNKWKRKLDGWCKEVGYKMMHSSESELYQTYLTNSKPKDNEPK